MTIRDLLEYINKRTPVPLRKLEEKEKSSNNLSLDMCICKRNEKN